MASITSPSSAAETTPSSCRTRSSSMCSPEAAVTSSSSERASRRLPSAARATRLRAPSSALTPSRSQMALSRPRISEYSSRRKAKMLAARLNCGGKLVRFSRGQNKERALRRLFQGFQQGVERLGGEHVDFVDDEHLVMITSWQVARVFAQLTDFVDAAVGGGVDFENIHRVAGGNLPAGGAFTARSDGGAFHAVERLGQDAGHCGLAHPPRARKDVTVRHAMGANGVLQCFAHQVLADHVIKSLGSIFAGNDLVGHLESSDKRWVIRDKSRVTS